MQALAACFPIYGAAASGEWAGRFSEALIIEVRRAHMPRACLSLAHVCLVQVFHASDTDMQDLALTTMRSLFSTLYPDEDASSAPATVNESVHAPPETEDSEMVPARQDEQIEGVAVQVVQNSLDEMAEPDKNNAKPAVRILTALIASSSACSLPVTLGRSVSLTIGTSRPPRTLCDRHGNPAASRIVQGPRPDRTPALRPHSPRHPPLVALSARSRLHRLRFCHHLPATIPLTR